VRTGPPSNQRPPFERVVVTDAALADLHEIKERAFPLLREVFIALKRLDAGTLVPVPLQDFAKTGDLRDCGKIVVETSGYPKYRIVVRDVGNTFEITEVVTVEERAGDLAYLVAGVRLGRITDPIRRSDAERRIARIRALRRDSPMSDPPDE
jgi:hypothetical protein